MSTHLFYDAKHQEKYLRGRVDYVTHNSNMIRFCPMGSTEIGHSDDRQLQPSPLSIVISCGCIFVAFVITNLLLKDKVTDGTKINI